MVLATIITSLENFLGLKPDADLDMLEVAGDGDNVEMTNEEESIASTEITVPSVASMPQQEQQQQQQQSLRKPPTKKKVVKEAWDEDATDEDEKSGNSASDGDDANGSLGNGPGGKGKSWLDPNGGGGLLDVLAAFQRLRTEFDEKFRAMWA